MRFGRRRYKIIHTVHAVYRYKLYNYGTKESDRGGGAHAVGELKHLCRVETIETIVFAVVARGSTCISLETVTKGVKHHPEYCFADFQEISEKSFRRNFFGYRFFGGWQPIFRRRSHINKPVP